MRKCWEDEGDMREQFGKDKPEGQRGDYAPLDLEADWSYLRANLDHPAHGMGNRLGSGLAQWLLRRFHSSSAPAPQLSILARIALGPRQSLVLVEAKGVHLLVGASTEGAPSFFSLTPNSGTPNSGYSPERQTDRAWESALQQTAHVSGGDVTSGVVRSRRVVPGSGVTGGSVPGRPANRLRLTGRVSWV